MKRFELLINDFMFNGKVYKLKVKGFKCLLHGVRYNPPRFHIGGKLFQANGKMFRVSIRP